MLTRSDEPKCTNYARVTIVDATGDSTRACPQHAVAALDGIEGARVDWADRVYLANGVSGAVGLVVLSGWEAVAEGDGECVEGGLPAHCPPGAAGPGRVQGPGDQVQALYRGLLGRYVESEAASSGRLISWVSGDRAVRPVGWEESAAAAAWPRRRRAGGA